MSTPQPGERPKTRDSRNGDGGSTNAAPAESASASAPRPVTVRDPSGDVGGGVEQAPASADIVAVRLSRRGDVVEVRTTFAAAVPSRQSGSKGMNVASFYDVDDNGSLVGVARGCDASSPQMLTGMPCARAPSTMDLIMSRSAG